MNSKPLEGQTTVITGASSGIGLAIAQMFAASGSDLVIAARNQAKLDEAATALRAHGHGVLAVQADLTRDEDVAKLFAAVPGRLDVFINNAGATIRARTEDVTPAQWRSVIDLNVNAAFFCAQAAFAKMLAQRGGRIINIGSVSARVSRRNSVAYTTSKFALDGMTRAMALDGRGHGVAVSIIHPGNTESAIWVGQEESVAKEGLMPGSAVARAVLLMATLPADINMLDATILPLTMPFIGRG
jgi:NAD(P)-dependent dehydrogenase (short-subunit alcohol dehydrogenase family)